MKSVQRLFILAAIFAVSFFAALHAPAFGLHVVKQAAVVVPAPAPFDLASADVADLPNPSLPISVKHFDLDRNRLILIEGGIAGTRRSAIRCGVRNIVDGCGACAGLNGTFFANASLRGTDNKLIGPSLCGDEQQVTLSPFDTRPELSGRPLVLLSPSRTRILPYNPQTMDTDSAVRAALPGVTDAFLGGVWLVHNGVAADDAKIASFAVKDANDYRRRAFFAVMPDGRPVLGASDCSLPSRDLADTLQRAGVQEAVLLDSGFSTSLVYRDRILVTGHSTRRLQSRPIPHAIVLFAPTPQIASSHMRLLRTAG